MRLCAVAALGVAAAALFGGLRAGSAPSWASLVEPLSVGDEVARGYRLEAPRRGRENDVVYTLRRERAAAPAEQFQVHVVPRGQWAGVRETRSFGVAYEAPSATAPTDDMEAVTERLAMAIRANDAGFASVNEIPLSTAGGASDLPRWTEALRGPRGALVGLTLLALALVAWLPGTALAWPALALAAFDLIACAAGLSCAFDRAVAVPLLFAAVLVAGAVWIVRRFRSRDRDLVLAAAAFAVGLALRLTLGAWGPFRIHGAGPLWVLGAAVDPSATAAYGPGYRELFGPVAALAPRAPDYAVYAVDALASASVVPAAYAIARLAAVRRASACLAALLMAFDPVAIRYAATESYFAAGTALAAWATVAVMVAARRAEDDRRAASVAWIACAGVLVAAGSRIHPVLWPPLALVPVAALAAPVRTTWPRRILLAMCLGVALAGVVLALTAPDLLDVYQRVMSGALLHDMRAGALGPVQAPRWVAAAVAVAAPVVLWSLAPRSRWLGVPLALGLGAALLTKGVYAQSWLWEQSFCRLHAAVPVVAAAALLPAFRGRRRVVWVLATLPLVALWIDRGVPLITARTTEHLEYRWLRPWIAALPAECRVIHVASAGYQGLSLPTYVAPPRSPSAFIAVHLDQPASVEQAVRAAHEGTCLYYLRTSLCAQRGIGPRCADFERRLTLTPAARATFPSLPSSRFAPYEGPTVETALFRATPKP